jgi:fibro-slime domain-containing protein
MGLAILTALALIPAALAVDPLPDEVTVSGITRDFQSSHVDFQVMPAGGFGHYAGLVDESLDAFGAPIFIGDGHLVLAPATDSSGRAIAPHLANMACTGGPGDYPPILADGRIRGRNQSVFDGYDSSLGPYGGANVTTGVVATNSTDAGMIVVDNSSTIDGDSLIGPGGDPGVVVEVQGTLTGMIDDMDNIIPIPPVTVPVGLPVYPGGDFNVPMNGSAVVSSDWHVMGEWDIKRGATVTINGDITMVCDNRWLIGKDATVLIPDGSSLTIYCQTQARLYGTNTVVNPDTSSPSKLQIYMLGSDIWNDQLVLNGAGTMLCANVVAPQNIIDLDQSAQFFGTFVGMGVEINNQSQFHMDMSGYGSSGMGIDPTLGDTAAVLDPAPSTGGVTSSATFSDWFDDVPSVNLSAITPITLVKQADDSYLFDDTLDPYYGVLGGFYPIDGRLFGEEAGSSHNDHFTHHVEAAFTYDAAAGQFFSYTGDADLWVFIDGQLAIDLGGVHGVMDQRIDLDRLCLQDGELYWLSFYLDNRYATMSSLRIETNLLFTGSNLPAVTAAFD